MRQAAFAFEDWKKKKRKHNFNSMFYDSWTDCDYPLMGAQSTPGMFWSSHSVRLQSQPHSQPLKIPAQNTLHENENSRAHQWSPVTDNLRATNWKCSVAAWRVSLSSRTSSCRQKVRGGSVKLDHQNQTPLAQLSELQRVSLWHY